MNDAEVSSQLYDMQSNLNTLVAAVGRWQARDDTRPQPEVRRAANAAMDAVDAMLRDLHAMRSRLVSEIRVGDDASAVRADSLLKRDAGG